MTLNIYQHILRFILLILAQVYILNNILFFNVINPYIYVYFILLLPFNIPKFLLILLSFTIGFTIDVFTGSYAIHAFATTLAGFVRYIVLKMYAPFDGYEKNSEPTLKFYDISWWLKYAFTMTIIHHFTLFLIETFHFQNIIFTFFKALLSTILSVILMTLLQYFFHKQNKS